MKIRRRFNPFGLSFLDIMACGFGAVTLLFLILRHNASEINALDSHLSAEVNLLNVDIRDAERNKVTVRNHIDQQDQQLLQAKDLSKQIQDELSEKRQQLSIQSDPNSERRQITSRCRTTRTRNCRTGRRWLQQQAKRI